MRKLKITVKSGVTSGNIILHLIENGGNILELGRSCVAKKYRTGATMRLLWSFIAQYIIKYEIDIMFDCASFPGVNLIFIKFF